MADPRFVHLRVHSDFSMVDGLQKIGPIVSAAAANNMPALALTDQMNMCGLVRFYGSAHGKGIKPLVGADFWVQSDELGDEQFRLTLLAMDNDGYQNITLLISRGYQRGHVQGRPVIDKAWLAEHAKGVIVLSGGREGDVGKFLLKGNRQMVEQSLAFYRTHFPDAYYLELLRTGRPDEEVYLHMAVAMPFLGSRVQLSEGRLGRHGIHPQRFSEKTRSERAAHFDEANARIRYSANSPDAPLLPGHQDRLSVFLQLAGLVHARPERFPTGHTVHVPTSGVRDSETWAFEVKGTETIRLPNGDVAALHLRRLPRKEFDTTVDVWLAPALGHVPVRMRLQEANGNVADQRLITP